MIGKRLLLFICMLVALCLKINAAEHEATIRYALYKIEAPHLVTYYQQISDREILQASQIKKADNTVVYTALLIGFPSPNKTRTVMCDKSEVYFRWFNESYTYWLKQLPTDDNKVSSQKA